MKSFLLNLVAIVCFLNSAFSPLAIASEEKYYVVLFSMNGTPDKPSLSHSFFTFVKLNAEGTQFSEQTISWLPENGRVRPLARVKGKNFSRAETLALAEGRKLTHFGPFRTTKAFYDLATTRIAFLKPENVEYKMFDWKSRKRAANQQSGGAINCQHAATDMLGFFDSGPKAWGAAATQMVRDFLNEKGVLVDYPNTVPEVLTWLERH